MSWSYLIRQVFCGPKFEDETVGYKLATTGAIKDTILNGARCRCLCAALLSSHYPEQLKQRYDLNEIPEDYCRAF